MFVKGPKQTSSISPKMENSKLEIRDNYHIFRATDDTEGANQSVDRNFVACLETFYQTMTSVVIRLSHAYHFDKSILTCLVLIVTHLLVENRILREQ